MFIYIKHLFILSILFQSHLIRHSGTQSAFKDTQRAFKHSKHWESTRAHGGHSDTWALKALGHFSSYSTQAIWALGHSKHSGTRGFLISSLFVYYHKRFYNKLRTFTTKPDKHFYCVVKIHVILTWSVEHFTIHEFTWTKTTKYDSMMLALPVPWHNMPGSIFILCFNLLYIIYLRSFLTHI